MPAELNIRTAAMQEEEMEEEEKEEMEEEKETSLDNFEEGKPFLPRKRWSCCAIKEDCCYSFKTPQNHSIVVSISLEKNNA